MAALGRRHKTETFREQLCAALRDTLAGSIRNPLTALDCG